MVTVIQQAPGNTATDVLGALNAVLQGIQANRDKGQEQQLKLLEILSKQPGAQLEPVAPNQLQQPNFLDYLVGAQPRTLAGAPAARFGGTALTVGRLPGFGTDPDAAAITKALAPPPGESTPGPITQTQMPLSNVTVPQAPAPASSMPPTAPTPGTATATPSLSADQQVYATMAQRIAKEEGVQNVPHFVGNIMQESGFDPTIEGRPTKYGTAKGLGQLIDSTAARYRVLDPFDPETNLRGSARYWKDLEGQFGGDPRLVAAAYNWGEQHLENAGRKLESAPSETQNHVRKVLSNANLFRGPATPPMENTPARLDQAQGARQTQRDPALAQAPSGPTITPPGAAEGKVAGPGAPALTPGQPTAPAPTPAQPVSVDTDREAQLTQRRLDANPDARMINIPGVGMRSQAWARDYLTRLKAFDTPGLYRTPENVFKYNEAKRKAADDLDKDEVQLRKDVQGAVEKHPGQEALFRNVRSQAELAGRVEQARSPGQLQTAATADLQSMLDRAPRDANGTYTPESLQAIARVQAYWGGYGVKPEAFKPQLDAAGVSASEEARKTTILAAPKAAAAAQETTATTQAGLDADPFKGNARASALAGVWEKKTGLKRSEFNATMRQSILTEADEQDAAQAGRKKRAEEGETVHGTDSYKGALQDLVTKRIEEGALPKGATANDLASGDRDLAYQAAVRRQGQAKQAELDILYDTRMPAEKARTYINPITGEKATEAMTPHQALDKGMLSLDAKERGTIETRLVAKDIVDKLKLLGLGGIDTKGLINGTPGESITGIFSTEGFQGRTFKTVEARIKAMRQDPGLGKQVAAYESLLAEFTPTLGRGVGGDSGHFTDADRISTADAIAKTGTGIRGGLQDTRSTAEAKFRLLEDVLDNGLRRALGPRALGQGGGGTGGATSGSTTTPPAGGAAPPQGGTPAAPAPQATVTPEQAKQHIDQAIREIYPDGPPASFTPQQLAIIKGRAQQIGAQPGRP